MDGKEKVKGKRKMKVKRNGKEQKMQDNEKAK